ncbi:hypothetical protein RB195_007431 [Necator americanus]|uniref:Uncharacterized protein n=1 Tax=Necator americanus TaxID=51031 RepID=A0ABR1BX98_NECAM
MVSRGDRVLAFWTPIDPPYDREENLQTTLVIEDRMSTVREPPFGPPYDRKFEDSSHTIHYALCVRHHNWSTPIKIASTSEDSRLQQQLTMAKDGFSTECTGGSHTEQPRDAALESSAFYGKRRGCKTYPSEYGEQEPSHLTPKPP